jgi:hypothetical protein
MDKTLASVRDKKFVDETFKRAKNASSPIPFFFLAKHAEDKKPVLLVGNPDAGLKKVALFPTSGVITGKCQAGKDGLQFFAKGKFSEREFCDAIKKVATNAGVSGITASVQALAEDEAVAPETKPETSLETESEADIPKLTFSRASWIEFSAVWGSKRSTSLKGIDDAFGAVASATKPDDKIEALSSLSKAIRDWLKAKEGSSRRLAMVSTLKEQVDAERDRVKTIRVAEIYKDYKERYSGAPGKDLKGEVDALDSMINQLNDLRDAAGEKLVSQAKAVGQMCYDAKASRQALIDAAEGNKKLDAAMKTIVSARTKSVIEKLKGGGKPLEVKEVYDALFEDFCAYGRKNFTYNTSAPSNADLLGGTKVGACGSFSTAYAALLNLVVGKKVAAVKQATATNFYTVPLSQVSFIDAKCPGNLRMSPTAQPDRYFFSQHWFASVSGAGDYCPTTGTKGSAVGAVVAKSGFNQDEAKSYVLGTEKITVEVGKGYGGGALYTLNAS